MSNQAYHLLKHDNEFSATLVTTFAVQHTIRVSTTDLAKSPELRHDLLLHVARAVSDHITRETVVLVDLLSNKVYDLESNIPNHCEQLHEVQELVGLIRKCLSRIVEPGTVKEEPYNKETKCSPESSPSPSNASSLPKDEELPKTSETTVRTQ